MGNDSSKSHKVEWDETVEFDDIGAGGGAASGVSTRRAPAPTVAKPPPGRPASVEDLCTPGTFAELFTDTGKELGSGAFSTVYACIEKKDRCNWAAKRITKSDLKPYDHDALVDEVSILAELSHPHIMGFRAFFSHDKYYYLVSEFIVGGELFDRIVERTTYDEKDACDCAALLLRTLAYLHERSIVHRDLKPENLLLASKDDDSNIKLADFGFAVRVRGPYTLSQVCGTPDYVAPEIIASVPRGGEHPGYGLKVDIWSAGVIAFILLGGYPPFQCDDENDRDKLFAVIRKGKVKFHKQYWGHISDGAKDLIRQMLTVDPDDRPSAQELLNHPWIQASEASLRARDLGVNQAKIKEFNAKRKLKAAARAVRAMNNMKKLASMRVPM